MNKKINIIGNSTESEYKRRDEFYDLFENSPIPKNEVLQNLGLYINRQSLSRILFMNDLYKKIVDVHGIAIEFGVRWGQNLALFESFRGIYEPYNYNRKIVGFDTFEGFKSLDKNDGQLDIIQEGAYSVTDNYEEYLEKILQYQESENPISNIKKYEIVKGDATKTIHTYLNDNPETIIALAYFDFDIYKPTKECLGAIKPYLTKGSVIGFDELNYHKFPGETIAFKEVFGLDKYKIRRSNISPLQAYIVIE
ncbi:crotonobetainyl-CoA--carnitine CoA-transferase [Clostridium botulinum]|uniref:crotonobetainyl-CoA--carnitine CoA-transferase n=1 Tax=Clostridium botulinum TaxID=1491 RepID=UPI0013F7C78F|nr:crotonobetainyl-CoA--carnitine CoA-transferase [Clostridium botulinum]MBN1041182.1 crotonobetainyl-CoA--carnitine CoA-transferase [Clostridium botulinum]MBN1047820.1 crotonobetainyl-CoA--carnitine CoA-transferase [Clostridium botulinum]NFO29851.1 crotonobetainyl-CoA--carnitine CoA-transferase [Clostridium botulinum]NFO52621.1 crotonobetainyl-CoA--carnitine CoA-transferase [Clostridium botulinum]